MIRASGPPRCSSLRPQPVDHGPIRCVWHSSWSANGGVFAFDEATRSRRSPVPARAYQTSNRRADRDGIPLMRRLEYKEVRNVHVCCIPGPTGVLGRPPHHQLGVYRAFDPRRLAPCEYPLRNLPLEVGDDAFNMATPTTRVEGRDGSEHTTHDQSNLVSGGQRSSGSARWTSRPYRGSRKPLLPARSNPARGAALGVGFAGRPKP